MIAITGAAGQLGRALIECCTRQGIDFIALKHSQLDVADTSAVAHFFSEYPCECIFNCAAYTQVDAAEDNPKQAFLVNSLAPWNLALTTIPIIHISTDYVFDGSNISAYEVDDAPRPLSIYGLSKRMGETSLLEGGFQGIIVRTAWTYSVRPGTKNFFHTMRRLFNERSAIGVVNDQIGTPTLAEDLAQNLIDLYLMGEHLKPMHVLHCTNEGSASWFAFAQAIACLTKTHCAVHPIASSEYPAKAQRPANSVLSLKAIQKLGIRPRPWLDALESVCKKEECNV